MDGTITGEVPPGRGKRNAEQVRNACHAALDSHRAYSFLQTLLLDIPVSHPAFGPAAETLELVRVEWLRRADAVGRLPAAAGDELLLKAAVPSRAIERNRADRPLGGPALVLAASLADDILVRPEVGVVQPTRAQGGCKLPRARVAARCPAASAGPERETSSCASSAPS